MQLWPYMSKVCCKCAAGSPVASRNESIVPAWGVHPALKTALDSLQSYDRWVANVVMPIAFQWIEEHKDEVYDEVKRREPTELKDLTDDVGVVIAAAFAIVEKTECYQQERSLWQILNEQYSKDSAPPVCKDTGAEANPIWSDISEQIQNEIREAFEKHRGVLGRTSGYPVSEPSERPGPDGEGQAAAS